MSATPNASPTNQSWPESSPSSQQPIEELLPRFYEDGHRIDPGPPWRSEGVDPVEQRQSRPWSGGP